MKVFQKMKSQGSFKMLVSVKTTWHQTLEGHNPNTAITTSTPMNVINSHSFTKYDTNCRLWPWREWTWATCFKLSTLGGCGGQCELSAPTSGVISNRARGCICAYVSLPLVYTCPGSSIAAYISSGKHTTDYNLNGSDQLEAQLLLSLNMSALIRSPILFPGPF